MDHDTSHLQIACTGIKHNHCCHNLRAVFQNALSSAYQKHDIDFPPHIFGGSKLKGKLCLSPCMTSQMVLFVAPLNLNLLRI